MMISKYQNQNQNQQPQEQQTLYQRGNRHQNHRYQNAGPWDRDNNQGNNNNNRRQQQPGADMFPQLK